jgi:hypothetical protein
VATPVLQEVVEATATPTTNITTDVLAASIGGGTDQLYVAFVSMRDASNWGVTSMSGGGLTWVLRNHHQDTQATLTQEIWTAFGSPGSSFQPTIDGFAIFSGAADTSLAAVVMHVGRVSGADPTTPFANAGASNTGATDTTPATRVATVGTANSLMLSATTTRAFTITSTDSDYAQSDTGTAGTAGNVLTAYFHQRTSASPAVGTDTISHTLSGAADWIVGAIEVRELGGTTLAGGPATVAFTGGTQTARASMTATAATAAWSGGTQTLRDAQVAPPPTVAWTGGSHIARAVMAAANAIVAWTGGTQTLRDTATAPAPTVAWTGGSHQLAAIMAASSGLAAWTGGSQTLCNGSIVPATAATTAWTGGAPTLAAIMAASTGAVAWTQPQVTLRSSLLAQAATVAWTQLSHTIAGAAVAPMVDMFKHWRRRRRF